MNCMITIYEVLRTEGFIISTIDYNSYCSHAQSIVETAKRKTYFNSFCRLDAKRQLPIFDFGTFLKLPERHGLKLNLTYFIEIG